MKILCIGPAYPLRGGISDFNEQLSRTLISEDHSVEIISYSLQYPSILFPGTTQYANYPAPKDLSIKSIINSINPFHWFRTAKYCISQNPNLIIVHYWMPFFAPALGTICKRISKKSNAHIIGICHNLIPHEPKLGDNLLTKYFTKHCTSFIAMSKSVTKDLLTFTKNKQIEYTPHPLYSNFGNAVTKVEACENLNLDANSNYILFFGLIRKYKGLDLLLKSLSYINLEKLKIKLLIAGEFYDKPDYYNEIIDQHKLQEYVIIRNEFIPQHEVPYYFCASDIVAQTYHSATQSGITQIAFHYNIPMLVTNVGGLSEIVLHNEMGYVCEKDPKEIADCLIDFYSNNRKEQYSKKVEIEKNKYSWENFTALLMNTIKTK